MTDMITVQRDDVATILGVAAAGSWTKEGSPKIAEAFERLTDAKDAAGEAGAEPEPVQAAEPPLPDGTFARVELPGFIHYTGWVTDGSRAGCPVVVVRDWDGHTIAEVVPQAMRQLVPLPTPLKRPEPQAALTAGGFGYEYGDQGGDDAYGD